MNKLGFEILFRLFMWLFSDRQGIVASLENNHTIKRIIFPGRGGGGGIIFQETDQLVEDFI